MRLFAEMADKGQAGLSYAFSAALELVHQGEVLFEIDGGLAETLWRLVHRAIGGKSEGVAKVIDVDIDGDGVGDAAAALSFLEQVVRAVEDGIPDEGVLSRQLKLFQPCSSRSRDSRII